MTHHLIKRALGVLSVALLVLVGCDTTASSVPYPEANGRLQVHLTDAPAELAKAVVTIERVTLVPSGAAREPVVLSDAAQTVDLLTLQDGRTLQLADAPVPPGTYEQLRLIVGTEGYVEKANGARVDLKVPSGPQTGIKILLPSFTVDAGSDVGSVTLDFNVEQSFIETPGRFLLKPTVRVQSFTFNAEPVTTVQLDGISHGLDTEARIVEVGGVPVHYNESTVFVLENGLDSYYDGIDLGIDAVLRDDGTLVARKVENIEPYDRGAVYVFEAPIASVDTSAERVTFDLLGVPLMVVEETEFEAGYAVDDLAPGVRVNVGWGELRNDNLARYVQFEEE
ncbi:DUF4382 domain-containing protein [Salisaeta longa]|uniref:DUF4382 domain-containing protein n=1 Tax=Salisaeta longa TaxID=503170 RepID=UPI0003B6C5F3|nr:DUF4382 domain-containing protein [Salisaeta longa]